MAVDTNASSVTLNFSDNEICVQKFFCKIVEKDTPLTYRFKTFRPSTIGFAQAAPSLFCFQGGQFMFCFTMKVKAKIELRCRLNKTPLTSNKNVGGIFS